MRRTLTRTWLGLTTLLLIGGCSAGYWPEATKGYIDYNQDGVREISEYIEPTWEYTDADTVLLVNRLIRDRRGESLKLIVYAPNQQIVARETRTIGDNRITHHQYPARKLVEDGGYGTYLANWRIGEDTIASYEFDIYPSTPGSELLDQLPPPAFSETGPDDLPAMWHSGGDR